MSAVPISLFRFSLFVVASFFGGRLGVLAASDSNEVIAVVTSANATRAEKIATQEFVERLARMYPREHFTTTSDLPMAGRAIVIAERTRDAKWIEPIGADHRLSQAESFLVTHVAQPGFSQAIVAGADVRGVVHAIYAVLEHLGCGFYLSTSTEPPPQDTPLNFTSWDWADAPLFADRLILDWHNFLSGASSWDEPQWRAYIDAAVRMRFNELMVHAYGNNPMFTFEYNGVTKPVGFIATTAQGRDWGTQHVNDVRRMIGGEIFAQPVFGAEIAQVPPEQRVAAATGLMQRVFGYARERGLGVAFALDVDTVSANPAEIVRTLPATAQFSSGKHLLANPDTPEGNAYYQAQVDQLLARYPQITRLVVWFRDITADTPWRRLQRREMPAAWQSEFKGPDEDVSVFALAKVIAAFRRAVGTHHPSVQLAAGSWAFPFLESADRYFPAGLPLIALDWWVSFDSARAARDLRRVQSGRAIIPIVWAHHDDRTYIGRSYTPFVAFATKLQRIHATGFGIVHWTTRPLDLYFTSTMAQTWAATQDQALEQTCDDTASRLFGESARTLGGQYLFSWITEGPMFGRETTDHFIDFPLELPEVQVRLVQERLALLDRIDLSALSEQGTTNLRYFQKYEQFIRSFFNSQASVERATEALRYHDYSAAAAAMGRADPLATIRAYVAAAEVGGMTRGEEAILVSLNLRWLPHVLSLRQAVGIEPTRYRLGVVQQEPLAQGAYPNTFYFDKDRRLWKVLDRSSLPAVLRLGAISGDKLAPGRYSVSGIGKVEARDGRVEIPTDRIGDEIVISPVTLGDPQRN